MDFDLEMIARLLLASLLGGLIGLEREVYGRPAGFRTHLLVSLGSCLFAIASIEFYRRYGNFTGHGPVGVDAARVAAQVVPGIGFLGAGAIIREGASVRGLTTAACLWIAAAVGLACGSGMYIISCVVTAISLTALLLLKKVEGALARDHYSILVVMSDDLTGQLEQIQRLLDECKLQRLGVNIEKDIENSRLRFEFEVKLTSREVVCAVVDQVGALSGVRKVSFS